MQTYTRREFTKFALLAVPGAGLLTTTGCVTGEVQDPNKPHSKVRGVQIGLNVPYSFANNTMSGDETLANCVALGISAVELRSQPVELFLGAKIPPARRGRIVDPAQRAAIATEAAETARALKEFRRTADPTRAREFRKKYEDAGVRIEIMKFDNIYQMTDAELDYAFGLAKAAGARAISCEISMTDKRDEEVKRLGRFADLHQLWVGYHGHTKVTPEIWERAFALAKFNGANVDIGHFIAGNHYSPVAFIKKYPERITHIHIKDRKMRGPGGEEEGPNVPFGQGDTPIAEVLRLLRDNRWPIQATIEFEYPIPEGSDRMTEIARAVKYCRDALA
jgi:sugar phosphate isomerase/epimerase